MPTRTPSSQSVSRSASDLERRDGGLGGSFSSSADLDDAGVVLHPAADDPAVPPGRRAGVAVGVEQVRRVLAEVEAALLPAHHRRVEHRQQRRPRLDVVLRVDVVRQHPAGPATVERHLDGAERRRARPGRRPSSRPATTRGRPRCRGRTSAASGATSSAYPSSSLRRRRYVAEPVGHQRPPRLGEPPVAGVLSADQRALDPQLAEHARRDRDVGAVRLARREVEPRLERGHLRADLLRGQRSWPPASTARTAARASVQPRRPVVGEPAPSRPPWPAGLLSVLGHPRRRAAPRRRQQVAREDEQRAPHRELLDQRAVVVQRPVDVGDGDPVDAGAQRQVDGGRLGGVQHRDRPRRRLGVGRAVPGRQRVPPRQPGAALGVGNVPHDG